jgi:HTH-type transcriptional regulator / antitoxin HigA
MINLTIKPIRTERDYEAALVRIECLMMAQANTPEADELEVLATLVERYEDIHYPIAAIRFRMEQQDLSEEDLIPLIGSRVEVTEVLEGKRDLTLAMMRKLYKHLGIPAEVLMGVN